MNVEIICITDRSGSMWNIRADVIGGYNQFLRDQKAVPGEARMTYAQFNHEYQVLYEGIPLLDAPELNGESFVPTGGTALLDAIGRTLEKQGERIAKGKWADKVIVYIITDGGENGSKEYQLSAPEKGVKQMIEWAQKNGWVFIFQAANQDAFAVGATYGFAAATTQNFAATSNGTKDAYASASGMTRSLRSQP